MRITLMTGDGGRVEYDVASGRFTPQAIPCFQCGTCCSRWQAPLDRREAQLISEKLGVPLSRFQTDYLQPYPMRPDNYLIAHKDGACTFLHREVGRSLCAIHDYKPQACRSWTPSLSRKECRDGLKRLAGPGELVSADRLNLSGEQLDLLCQSLRGADRNSIMRG